MITFIAGWVERFLFWLVATAGIVAFLTIILQWAFGEDFLS